MICKKVGECKQEKINHVCTKGRNLYARNGGAEGITGRSQQHPVVTQELLTGGQQLFEQSIALTLHE